ncbi:P-II family nitrogen regulator [Methanosalsum natronophilum]|nr:P-II family nitrogen regulator [Methanosalsum natronophilum]MCS3924115.1 nitrogen regulatory protein P-II 1 [Methanosalsum natronophilum]
MKKIEAIIRNKMFPNVKDALESIGISSMTVAHVEGRGKQKGVVQQWRGRTYSVDLIPKIKIEMVVPDKDVEKLVEVIKTSAATGTIGDGKIFVSPVESAIRIRTGDKDESAL